MICPTAPPMATSTRAISVVTVDSEPNSRIWPVRLNGIDTAAETMAATRVASSRMPSTRQKSLRTNLIDRETAVNTPSRSSTISGGAKLSAVHR